MTYDKLHRGLSLTVRPLNVSIIFRNDLLIFICERSIRIPLADCMISKQTEVQISIVVHYHSVTLNAQQTKSKNKLQKNARGWEMEISPEMSLSRDL